MRCLFLALLQSCFVLLILSSIHTAEAAASEQPSGTEVRAQKIMLEERVRGFRRSFRIYVPSVATREPEQPRPLVVMLHGGLASARTVEKQSGWTALAERHGFYVLYPNGMGIFSLLRHWNGGYCCARSLSLGLDDVGFVDRVVQWVEERHSVDPRKIYMVGYSNGGMLAHWYASERADRLAGVAIWASSIGSLEGERRSWSWSQPNAVLPVMIAHGTADPRLPYDKPGGRKDQKLLGAVGSAVAWAESNGCDLQTVKQEQLSPAVERRTWCAEGEAPVVFLGLDGWGHDWPGPKFTDRLPEDQPLHGFHLAQEMWRFFSHSDNP